ncbi:MAG: DUF4258 domain-containing protein [Roseburia sp.]|nr:DUF4258 domain-containing protein [Roseburia sp.]
MNITEVQALCAEGRIIWTEHVEKRMAQRKISRTDVKRCIMSGEIIEDYLDDYPYPSCLIFGYTEDEKNLHVVVSISDGIPRILNIITAYVPDESKFMPDMKTRRGK